MSSAATTTTMILEKPDCHNNTKTPKIYLGCGIVRIKLCRKSVYIYNVGIPRLKTPNIISWLI